MKLTSFVPVCALALSGCSLVAPTTSQLSNFKKWEEANNLTAIESATIKTSCAAGDQECVQLAEIQGRACLTLVKQDTQAKAACPAFTPVTQKRLQCAATDFKAALTGRQFPQDQMDEITEMRARALYCHANTLSRPDGLSEAKEASQALATLADNPERDQLAASAALYVANTSQAPAADRCSAARNAVTLANSGLRGNPSGDLQQGLTATREHATSVAGSLSNCSVQ